MRHLTTEELLLYAEGELEERGLCLHVPGCVDCKARLVDVQETYVHAAAAIRSHAQSLPEQPAQMQRLRERLAVESALLSAHLSTEDLLLSLEGGLSDAGLAHHAVCVACQDRAADIHVKLAEIEVEIHRQFATEVPSERRAAALAALRVRLAAEVERRAVATSPVPRWRPRFSLPRLVPLRTPAFASYAGALAMTCLAAWLGFSLSVSSVVPAPESIARLEAPQAPAIARTLPAAAAPAAQAPRRFKGVRPAVLSAPPAPAPISGDAPPDLVPAVGQPYLLALDLQNVTPRPHRPPAWPEPASVPVSTQPADSLDSVVEGTWRLARTGYWKMGLRAGGAGGTIRFSGPVATESERLAAEKALLAVADGWPVEFAFSVQRPAAAPDDTWAVPALGRGRQAGGLVRNSLLEHYADAARRSFVQVGPGLLENELDRYVSGVLRHDGELLSHAHALRELLSRPGIEGMQRTDAFRQVVRFHLDGISRHEKGIYDRLSEALPRRYWAYSSGNPVTPEMASLGSAGSALVRDCLALDRALNGLLLGGSESLDAGESNLSSASLLARVRQHARRLRAAVR